MSKFQISINGKKFLMINEGEKTSMGFFATRWVEASSQEEAEQLAIMLIKNDQNLKEAIINEKDNPPLLYAEEILEINSFDGVDPPVTLARSGYARRNTQRTNNEHPI